jgi:cation diffusion facilitator family transporter
VVYVFYKRFLVNVMESDLIIDTEESTNNKHIHEVRRVTIWGLILNIVLTVLKIVIGYFGGSTSVVADGVHSLSDCSTDVAVIVGVKYWDKAPDDDHPYGHRRIEAMTSVFIGIVLGLVGILLIYNAMLKLHSQQFLVPEWSAFIIAIISIVTKEILYRWTKIKSEELKSNALKANAWHHRSDAISSIPVAIAIGFTKYDPSWKMLDPIASIAVSAFILNAAYTIVWPSLCELSDSGASEAKLKDIEKLVSSVEGIQSIHALRTRYQGNGLYVDLHIQVDPDITVKEGHDIAAKAKYLLIEQGPDIKDVLVHVEPGESRKDK